MIQIQRFSTGDSKSDYPLKMMEGLTRTLNRLFVTLLLFVLSTGFVADRPNILIIGDSISIGYTPFVKEKLTEKANVFHNPGNAQHTGTGLKKITEWVGNEDWDIIQFNWGLWDLCYRHPDSKVQGKRDKVNGEITFSVAEYAANLDSLVTTLKQLTDAKLIFVATSYVPKNEAGRFTEDAPRYNAAAKEVMKKHSVTVNDIYESSRLIHRELGKGSDNVHYTAEGSKELGELIATFIEKEMEK